MVKMISWNGTEMLVTDDRVEEYKAAGCVLAAKVSEKPTVEVPTEEKVEVKEESKAKTKKATAKRK